MGTPIRGQASSQQQVPHPRLNILTLADSRNYRRNQTFDRRIRQEGKLMSGWYISI